MLRLLKLLGDRYDYEYVVNEDDITTTKKIFGKVYKLNRARNVGDSKITLFLNGLRSIPKSFSIIRKTRPYAIISAGPGLTIPLFLFGKVFGCKNIFLETWARAHTKSLSGRICYPLSNLFFVQWPEMKKQYPKAVYAGRLG
jgi:beta-1,4-N-acetylglucosaminyltransferase